MVNFTPRLHYLTEWWKQARLEGKEKLREHTAGVDRTDLLHGAVKSRKENVCFSELFFPGRKTLTALLSQTIDNLDQFKPLG